ncbi:MAG: DEAD/DEAH box helicase [Myxococcales bacterium]|nr:DEAD/DEAH box helicase [Myxococcales bacterium]
MAPSKPNITNLMLSAIRQRLTSTSVRHAELMLSRGQVMSVKETDDGWAGTVHDRRPYKVSLDFTRSGELKLSCTCDYGKAPCAHALALAMTAAARSPSKSKDSSSRTPDAPTMSPAVAELFKLAQNPARSVGLRQEDVIVWASRHGVSGHLSLYLQRIPGLLAKAPPMTSQYEGVLRALTVTPYAPHLADLPRVVAEWLMDEVDRIAELRAERRRRLEAMTAPTEPALVDAWEATVNALVNLPVPVGQVGVTAARRETTCHMEIIDLPLMLVVKMDSPCNACTMTGAIRGVKLKLDSPCKVTFTADDYGAGLASGCACVEAELDHILNLLQPGSTNPVRAKVLEVLSTPAWRRSLLRMDDAIAAPQTYGLVVTPGTRGVVDKIHLSTVTPKKRGGVTFKRAQDISPGAPAHVIMWSAYLPERLSASEAWRISSLLAFVIGRDDVYIAGQDRPCTVHASPVTLTTRKAKIGNEFGNGLAFEFAGETAPLLELATLQGQMVTHLSVVREDQNQILVGVIPDSLRDFIDRARPHLTLVVPKEGTAELVRHLVRTGTPLALPKTVAGKPMAVTATPVLRATWSRPALTLQFGLHYHDDYPVLLAGEGPPTLYVDDGGDVRHIDRNLTEELELSNAVAAALGVDLIALSSSVGALVPATELARAFELMKSMGAGDHPELPKLRIDWTTVAPNVLVARPAQVKVNISSGRDWFGLAGGLDIGGKQVPLGLLLKAIRERHTYIELGSDDLVVLSESLTDALGPMAGVAQPRAGKKGNDEWRLTRLGAATLGDAQDAGMFVDGPDDWADLLERVQEAATLEIPLPPDLRADLRHYQLDGFHWLARLAHWSTGACLCDDMGLGKTVQAIALLLHRVDAGPALVVAPTSVGFNWVRELERFAPSLRPRLFRGATTKRLLEGLRSGDVLITNYELLASYAPDFHGLEWGTLVLDEAQAVKNATTLRARAAAEVSAKFRVALTGTPIENRTDELWSLFHATVPGLFGSFESFRERFGQATERRSGAHQARVLSKIVRPFILRRLKREVARELPARTDINVEVDLSPAERKLYEQIRRSVVETLTQGSDAPPQQIRFQILTALTRLRQAACHPRLLDPRSTVPSSKLDALLQIVDDLRAEGHRALVFSQFTSHLALVREALDARGVSYRYLDGSTPAASRRGEVDAFQAGEGDVFLLSLKAGGTGLNLTGADYVIHLDPWWNPAVEDQATDRAHRIGQTRAVTVYRIVARDTLEDRILSLHADKRELMTTVLDGTSDAGPMSTDELMDLMNAGLTDIPEDPEERGAAPGRLEPITAGALPPGPTKAADMEVVDGPPAPKRRGRPPKNKG